MKLLVIGGSYFYGRVFVMLAAAEKHDITVVNRGTYSMEEFGVRQVRGDRRQGRTFAQCTGDYDVVIDFCAYNPGDAAFVLEHPGAPYRCLRIKGGGRGWQRIHCIGI